MRLRFAPSPTGLLHVGNARTALFNWLLARGSGGQFILRIEDTDAERSSADAERSILEDLRWLGLDWDEGVDVGGPCGPYRQSERLAIYRDHAERLLASGDAYHCFCTSEQLETERRQALAEGRPPRYSGRCRTIGHDVARARVRAGEPAALRLRVPPLGDLAFDDLVRGRVVFHTDVIGDPVILRSDGTPAYNFAVVVDDASMGITHVVRGEDHVSNTPRQLLVYRALGLRPPVFAHVALVLGPDHSPLSKRHGATAVREFRDRGYLPEALVNYLALLGWSPGTGDELLPLAELVRRFRIEDVNRSAAVFDLHKLAWVNRHYLKAAPADRLVMLALPYLQRPGWVSALTDEGRGYLATVVPPAARVVDRLDEVADRLRFVFVYDAGRALAHPAVAEEMQRPEARDVVRVLAAVLAETPRMVDRDRFRDVVARVRQQTGRKGRDLLHPVRVALTGEPSGMELDLAVPAIERAAELSPQAGVGPVVGCRERARAFVNALDVWRPS